MTDYVYTSGGFPSAPTSGDSLVINGAYYDWTGGAWKIRNATPLRSEFIATANQATKTGLTYFVGSIDCYINGAKMLLGTDFTATNGTSVTFTPALDLDDEVQLIMGVSASSAAGASSLDSLSDTTVSTTDPLMTTNPPAVGHLWINSTTGEAYVCKDITTNANNWVNIGAANDGFDVGPFAATGGTGSAGGGYAYRTFTSSSTFTTSKAGTVDFIIVAGGGGAGTSNGAAGAGAGGLVYQSNYSVALGTFNIIIGAGGSASTSVSTMPNVGNGDNSTAFGFTAIGGGGSGNESNAATKIGASGGSGGGGVRGAAGGSGTSGQGYAGGSSVNDGAPHYRGGGGGGAGGVGQNGTSTGGGNAGLGGNYSAWSSTTSTGDNGYYASGGAAGSYDGAGVGGTGGSETAGGGGLGGTHRTQPELNGNVNTGGGGGGHGHTGTQGGNGGSGIVIIRYAV
jgi:hypothetical protein